MPRGLLNLGNTCYLNSAVQALFHVPALTRHFKTAEPYAGSCDITREYAAVVHELLRTDEDSPVNPAELLRAFRRRFAQFDNRRQHDAAEALGFLLDVLEESLGKPFMNALFQGQTTQTVTYLKPSSQSPFSVSVTVDPFVTVPLTVTEPGFTLDELLEQAAEPSHIYDYVDHEGEVHMVATSATAVTTWPAVCVFVFGSYDCHFKVRGLRPLGPPPLLTRRLAGEDSDGVARETPARVRGAPRG